MNKLNFIVSQRSRTEQPETKTDESFTEMGRMQKPQFRLKRLMVAERRGPTQQTERFESNRPFPIDHPIMSPTNLKLYESQEEIKAIQQVLCKPNMYKILKRSNAINHSLLSKSQIYVYDDEVMRVIETILEFSVKFINAEADLLAIQHLHKVEQIIESYHRIFSDKLPIYVYVQLFCNFAILFTRLQIYDEAHQQFITASQMIKEEIQSIKSDDQSSLKKVIFYNFLRLQIHLNIQILLSQRNSHQIAFIHCQKAAKLSIKNCIHFIQHLNNETLQKQDKMRSTSVNNTPKNPTNVMDLKETMTYALVQVVKMMSSDTKYDRKAFDQVLLRVPNELKIQNMLRTQIANKRINEIAEQLTWTRDKSIMSLLLISPLSRQDFFNYECNFEDCEDLVVLNICYCVLSYYCMSTECRFFEKEISISKLAQHYKLKDSELYIAKSLEIGYQYFVTDSQLVQQVISIYQRFHGIDKQVIPEDAGDFPQSKFIKLGLLQCFYKPMNNKKEERKYFIPLIRFAQNNEPPTQKNSYDEIQSNTRKSTVERTKQTELKRIYQVISAQKKNSSQKGRPKSIENKTSVDLYTANNIDIDSNHLLSSPTAQAQDEHQLAALQIPIFQDFRKTSNVPFQLKNVIKSQNNARFSRKKWESSAR